MRGEHLHTSALTRWKSSSSAPYHEESENHVFPIEIIVSGAIPGLVKIFIVLDWHGNLSLFVDPAE
jgi:hypothetical protein